MLSNRIAVEVKLVAHPVGWLTQVNCWKRRHRKQAKDAERLEPKGTVERFRVCPLTLT
jgi:hypothetical protein